MRDKMIKQMQAVLTLTEFGIQNVCRDGGVRLGHQLRCSGHTQPQRKVPNVYYESNAVLLTFMNIASLSRF